MRRRPQLSATCQTGAMWHLDPRRADFVVLLTLAMAAAVAVGATMLAGEIYQAVLADSGVALLDQPVLDWMIGVRTPELNAVIAAFSASGGPLWMTLITAAVAGLLCWLWKQWTPLVLTAIAVAGSLAMTTGGKRLSGRARPPLESSIPPPETSASFPSGHSLNSLVIAGILVYLLISRQVTALARAATVTIGLLYAAAMGLSRVYLGHHWLTDVLGAWCLGLAWLAVVITWHRLWVHRHPEHDVARVPSSPAPAG